MTESCNIEARGIAGRRGLGIVVMLIASAGAVWMISAGLPWAWRIALLPVFWFGLLGLLQAHEKV